MDAARNAVERASRLPLADPYTARLSLVADRLRLRDFGERDDGELTREQIAGLAAPQTAGAVGTLGVVLPLTGSFGSFGEESLRGIMLAAGVFEEGGASGPGPGIRIAVRDSAGDPARAAEAVRELARDPSVVAVLGPLLSAECESAAAAAESERLPLLALTARQEVARERPYVFRVRTLPQEEAERLVDHAVRDLGAQRFGILYPRDAYGRGLSGLFWRAVEERGGRVVALASYEPEATDFAKPIRRLAGFTLLTRAEKERLKVREEMLERARRLPVEEASALREEAKEIVGPRGEPLPPIVDFDALFIPESHEKVVLIAPQLAFHEVTGTRLLGPDAWNHPDLVTIARDHVEGAYFTANFFAGSDLPFVREFAARYAASYDESPELLAAQAYDAANLVLVQLARGEASRQDVREGILETRLHPGVSGVLSMRADGNARKRPYLLRVERGRIQSVD